MKKTVLIIDDDIAFLKPMKQVIYADDREILTVDNIDKGIEILKMYSEQLNLICSDYSLRGNHTVMEILSAIDELKFNMPVIIFSARDEDEYVACAKSAGALEYYTKESLSIQKIRYIVSKLLD